MLPWRIGGKVGRTIYAFSSGGWERLIGVMDGADLAAAVVSTHNASLTTGPVDGVYHEVEWTIDRYGINSTITCHAPAGAPCHLTCPTNACETWQGGACACGPLINSHECNASVYLNNDGPADCYIGKEQPLRDGPIEVRWQGDGYGWLYYGQEP